MSTSTDEQSAASIQEHIPNRVPSQPELAVDCLVVEDPCTAAQDSSLLLASSHVSTALLNMVVAELCEELALGEFLEVLDQATAQPNQIGTSVVMEHTPQATSCPRGDHPLEPVALDGHSSLFAAPFHVNHAGSQLVPPHE